MCQRDYVIFRRVVCVAAIVIVHTCQEFDEGSTVRGAAGWCGVARPVALRRG